MSRWAAPVVFTALAAFALAHAVSSLADLTGAPSARASLVAVYFVLRALVGGAFAYFMFARPAPKSHAREPLAVASCVVAMALVTPFGGPGNNTATALVLSGDLLAVVSCVWLFVSVLALGRCFGILPEARGLVTRGPYRVVRHPVYLGEIGALAGLAVASSEAWTVAMVALFTAAQAIRMRLEERVLSTAFPEYVAYAAVTPRLIPRVRMPRASAAPTRPAPWSSST